MVHTLRVFVPKRGERVWNSKRNYTWKKTRKSCSKLSWRSWGSHVCYLVAPEVTLYNHKRVYFAFFLIFCYTFSMTTNISTLLDILSSLRNEWIYADAIISKIQSGNLRNEDIVDIVHLITESLMGIENEDVQMKMRNILFQISLIHLEEWELRKQDQKEANETITHL